LKPGGKRRGYNPEDRHQEMILDYTLRKMNEYFWELVPEMKGERFFWSNIRPSQQEPLIRWDFEGLGRKYSGAVNLVRERYRRWADNIFNAENYFANSDSEAVALGIWETPGVFLVDARNAIKTTAGTLTPYYIDCRELQRNPINMNRISCYFQSELMYLDYEPHLILGGELGGVPFATKLGSDLFVRTGIVRKEQKAHGIGDQIIGQVCRGERAILIEDLLRSGKSSKYFVNVMRDAGLIVDDVFFILDRKEGGRELLEEMDVRVHCATDIDKVLEVAQERGLTKDEYDEVMFYRRDSSKWLERWKKSCSGGVTS